MALASVVSAQASCTAACFASCLEIRVTGKPLWRFDSGIRGTRPDRGLAYSSDGAQKRTLVGVMNFLDALDAITGKPMRSKELSPWHRPRSIRVPNSLITPPREFLGGSCIRKGSVLRSPLVVPTMPASAGSLRSRSTATRSTAAQ